MAYFKLPLGVQDLLPDECYNLNVIKAKLTALFEGAGYRFVSTAILDYYDTYSEIRNKIPQEKMFKMTDLDGSLLVLRPDMTLSVCRMAAKLKEKRTKLAYFSNIWNARESGGISAREVLQGGVEMLGVSGAYADAEMIALAIECGMALGLQDFILDIGHVGFFKGILRESGLSSEETEEVRRFVNAKDIIGAQRIVGDSKAKEAILALPTLFGGVEVIDRAERLTDCEASLEALRHLREVYELLVRFGYEKYISIDLGTVKSLSYYSGVVFTGLSGVIGASVLSGGRYDALANEFGSDFPAVGFAVGLKRVLIALERQGDLVKAPAAECCVIAEPHCEAEAYAFCLSLRKKGKRAELFHGEREKAMRSGMQVYLVGKEGGRLL